MLPHIMLSGPMTSRSRMPMASSWKLKTKPAPDPDPGLRRKKSLGSMPSPAFARAGLEPVNRLAVALAVGVVHGREHIRRPRQFELDDRQCQAGMTLEDAGEDHVAHRQCRIERLGFPAAGVAQCSGAGPADLALPPRRRVQAQWHLE